jgi:hypothetical protein
VTTQLNNDPQLQSVPALVTPMDMLDRAITSGADITILEKLMGLQERYEKNQARKDFDAAVAAAKAEIPPIIRNREGHGSRKYADFAAIAKVVDPIISRHGLTYRFRTQQDERIHVTCVLSHRAGHYEETTLSGPADASGSKNAIQAIGSTLSYLQRYSLVQMLGLAATDDDDGKAAGGGGTITDEQSETIKNLIGETKTDINKFLQWAGAESVSDIASAKYNDAITFLNAKKQAKK